LARFFGSIFVLVLVAVSATAGSTAPAAAGGNDPTCDLTDGVLEIDPGFWEVRIKRVDDVIAVRHAEGAITS
jgi:hypothetical protein